MPSIPTVMKPADAVEVGDLVVINGRGPDVVQYVEHGYYADAGKGTTPTRVAWIGCGERSATHVYVRLFSEPVEVVERRSGIVAVVEAN